MAKPTVTLSTFVATYCVVASAAAGTVCPPLRSSAVKAVIEMRPFALRETNGLADLASRLNDQSEPPMAVYNLQTHIVSLPDGTRLEAHSGYGKYVDDPRFVHLRMRGATPPGTYELALRKGRFHGVLALRLSPVLGDVFGRSGLLAHSYMLHGGRPESNGCVVFRNYPAFLRAFLAGGFQQLRVVSGSKDPAFRSTPFVSDVTAVFPVS